MFDSFNPYDNFYPVNPIYLRQLDQRRRELEYQRRLQEERERQRLLRQRQLEEEYRRRMWEEEERERLKRRRQQEEAFKRSMENRFDLAGKSRLADYHGLKTNEPTKIGYQLVRGPYGLLYRVPVVYDEAEEESIEDQHLGTSESDSEDEREKPTKLNGSPKKELPFQRVNSEEVLPVSGVEAPGTIQTVPRAEPKSLLSHDKDEHVITIRRQKSKPGDGTSRQRKKITVIVEDASDSEDEDNELRSVWRNRRPSPGQWMEPIEM